MTSSSLTSLPKDLSRMIISYLDIEELISLGLAKKDFIPDVLNAVAKRNSDLVPPNVDLVTALCFVKRKWKAPALMEGYLAMIGAIGGQELKNAYQQLTILEITDSAITRLPPEIGNFCNLRKLTVSLTELDKLPKQLKKCRHLKVLDVSSNQLSVLGKELKKCVSLKKVNISANPLKKIPKWVERYKLLTVSTDQQKLLAKTVTKIKVHDPFFFSREGRDRWLDQEAEERWRFEESLFLDRLRVNNQYGI